MTLDEYMDALFNELSFLSNETKTDLLLELKCNILDEMELHPERTLDSILASLGTPQALASRYHEELGVSDSSTNAREKEKNTREKHREESDDFTEDRGTKKRNHDWTSNLSNFIRDAVLQGVAGFSDKCEDVKKTFDLKVSGNGELWLPIADIELQSHDEPTMHLELELQGKSDAVNAWELPFETKADSFFLKDDAKGVRITHAVIYVPEGVSKLAIVSTSGDIEAEGIDFNLAVRAVSGGFSVTDARGDVAVESASGEIEAHDCEGSFYAKTLSGEVYAEGIDGGVSITTVSGDIEVIDSKGRLLMASTSGSISVEAAEEIQDIEAVSISGDIDVVLLNENANISAKSLSGSIEIFNQEYRSRFSPIEKVFGTGDSKCRFITTSGNIDISLE